MTWTASADLRPPATGPADADRGHEILQIETDLAADEIGARGARAEILALDVEANGLFAYRPKACTVQLAWREDGRVVAAIIDTLQVDVRRLTGLLGPAGPVKVLHDLTFDDRLLEEAGVQLANVRDTSVAARLLGSQATGLGALVAVELGVTLPKRFQKHDWAERPLTAEHVDYLAGDVLHLLDLEVRLRARIAELDLTSECAAECAYKLRTAAGPPRDARPSYARIKGASELDPQGRAALRHLVEAREVTAMTADVPPFKIVGHDVLLELAKQRPRSLSALHGVQGATSGRAARLVGAWLEAIARGVRDRDVPVEDRPLFERPRTDRAALALRRAREAQITRWRRAEALARNVIDQAVLPGHCVQDLLEIMLTPSEDNDALRDRIAAIPGLGSKRFERYGEAFVGLVRSPALADVGRGPAVRGVDPERGAAGEPPALEEATPRGTARGDAARLAPCPLEPRRG